MTVELDFLSCRTNPLPQVVAAAWGVFLLSVAILIDFHIFCNRPQAGRLVGGAGALGAFVQFDKGRCFIFETTHPKYETSPRHNDENHLFSLFCYFFFYRIVIVIAQNIYFVHESNPLDS